MTDREKILIWLEKCLGVCNENTNCDLCPFDKTGTYDYNCAEQLEDAIRRELLKNEPVKPIVRHSIGPTWWYACGSCEEPIGFQDRFCCHCGREVLWDG